MSYYSNNPNRVRVDFWKPSGKWYVTEEMIWLDYGSTEDSSGRTQIKLIHDVFMESLIKAFPNNYHDLDVTCLEPYHMHTHPLMLKAGWFEKGEQENAKRIQSI